MTTSQSCFETLVAALDVPEALLHSCSWSATKLPGYWTVRELAERIGRTEQYIRYKVKGRFKKDGELESEALLPYYQPYGKSGDIFVEFWVGARFISQHLNHLEHEGFLTELSNVLGLEVTEIQGLLSK